MKNKLKNLGLIRNVKIAIVLVISLVTILGCFEFYSHYIQKDKTNGLTRHEFELLMEMGQIPESLKGDKIK